MTIISFIGLIVFKNKKFANNLLGCCHVYNELMSEGLCSQYSLFKVVLDCIVDGRSERIVKSQTW